jgi:hypothetical protein
MYYTTCESLDAATHTTMLGPRTPRHKCRGRGDADIVLVYLILRLIFS